MSKPKAAALRRFEEGFEKSFGEGTLRRGTVTIPYEVSSTGSIMLDIATGVGGFVEGRTYEFWGSDAIGKTSMALIAAAEYQKKYPNKFVAFIDMEATYDDEWGKTLGLDTERLFVINPNTAEDVADQMDKLVIEGREKFGIEFGFVVLDSVGAMMTKAEHEKDAVERTVAGSAMVVTRMAKKMAVAARNSGAIIVYINQVREKIGKMGDPEDTPGGRALKHATTMKFRFRVGGESIKDKRPGEKDPVIVGRPLKVRLDRNKVAPPFRVAEVVFMHEPSQYGPVGVNRASETFMLGQREGIDTIKKAGGWYRWYAWPEDQKALQGGDAMEAWLREHPEAIEETRKLALAQVAHLVIPEEEIVIETTENEE